MVLKGKWKRFNMASEAKMVKKISNERPLDAFLFLNKLN